MTGLSLALREFGHEPAGVLTTALGANCYGADTLGWNRAEHAGYSASTSSSPPPPPGSGRCWPALDADVALSAAFPVLIPADALNVPRLGIINTHPALLPRYRGPNPIGWTVRNGDRELGYSVHRMDEDFDTGPLLAQGATPIHDATQPDEVFGRMFALLGSLLPEALARVEADDRGDPQPTGESYAGSSPSTPRSTGRAPGPRSSARCSPGGSRPTAAARMARSPRSTGPASASSECARTTARAARRWKCADGPLWVVEVEHGVKK